MIIFAVSLRASEVGCFWAADGTGGYGEGLEEKLKEKQEEISAEEAFFGEARDRNRVIERKRWDRGGEAKERGEEEGKMAG